MVTSGNERKKLYHKESVTIRDGDVIELIPGKYMFQYRTVCGDSVKKSEESSRKRLVELECGENGSSSKRFKVLFFFNVDVVELVIIVNMSCLIFVDVEG